MERHRSSVFHHSSQKLNAFGQRATANAHNETGQMSNRAFTLLNPAANGALIVTVETS